MFPELLRIQFPDLAPEVVAALNSHYELLLRWNKSLNLTRITGLQDALERHYCESIFLALQVPTGSCRIADIGSGAGFPGFPLAAVRPDCAVTLIESHQRKSVFLREAARGAPNLRILSKRAEDVHEEFDITVSRAVSYEDLSGVLGKLAPLTLLLTGSEEPPESIGFRWQSPLSLPWGERRFLRVGHIRNGRFT